MNLKQINEAWIKAKSIHAQMPKDDRPSLDAVFLAFAGSASSPHDFTPAKFCGSPPNWFSDALKNLEPQHAPASSIWAQITGKQPSTGDARKCGQWLRHIGYASRKSNGVLLFILNK